MADDWENDDNVATGKSFGGVGGYKTVDYSDVAGGDDDDWKDNNSDKNGYAGGNGGFSEYSGGGGYGNGGYEDRPRGRGGRGGGRGRGRGRGRDDNNSYGGDRNGYGGGRDRNNDHYNDENGDGDFGDRPRRGGRGGGRGGGGRGGRGGYNNGDGGTTEEKPRELYIPPEPTDDETQIFATGISSGINFKKYDNIPVKVTGENPPAAINSFSESGLKEFILENVTKSGYTIPTPIQKTAIPIIMAKRDLMGCAQTGSGKTAAFLLPIVNDLLTQNTDLSIGRPQALIISPTRELSIQIFEEARKFALRSYLKISLVYGGTAVKHQGENVAKGCHILVATPGRLLDFMDRGFISFEDTRFIVLDEADRMLDMGFLPGVEKVMNHPTILPPEERQSLMFSATFPEDIQRLAGQFLNNYIFIAVGIVGGACTDIEQNFYEVTKYEKRVKLMEILKEEEAGGTMVFVDTKRNADFLASLMSETKFPTTSIHGDRLQRERELALQDFKTGKMSVLISTSVASRGLDIKNVVHVINYDLPRSIDEYVHRIGRTGRVGNSGKATSFFDPDQDSSLASDLVKILEQAEKPVPEFLRNINSNGCSYSNKQFGGRDVRGGQAVNYDAPEAQEPEEDWLPNN